MTHCCWCNYDFLLHTCGLALVYIYIYMHVCVCVFFLFVFFSKFYCDAFSFSEFLVFPIRYILLNVIVNFIIVYSYLYKVTTSTAFGVWRYITENCWTMKGIIFL